ncbi:hypothetical protein [Microbulbifer halophilus]|uniref:Uncharacterized protein n=1 Tax=Microbulbifer halophilus TaxID=453963 RepID=A0ABW5EDI1_9GAMM|nr:hypothetical protein [Microbulbifer halophilus]MCW8125770.1 hypothetical protein [Microbulbifer halophilus]
MDRERILQAVDNVQAELDGLRALVQEEQREPALDPDTQPEWLETHVIVHRFGITDDHARKMARRLAHTGGAIKPEGRWLLDPEAVREALGRHV